MAKPKWQAMIHMSAIFAHTTVPCQQKKYIFSIVSTPQESNQGEKALIAVHFSKSFENGLRVA